jgi:hypothetical protein
MSKNSLDKFELYYEELEKKKVAKAKVKIDPKLSKPKTTFKMRVESVKKTVRSRFDNMLSKFKKQPKKAKKISKSAAALAKKEQREQQKRAILGIGLLLVIVSIIYSTTVVREFVNSTASLVALAPQVIFAVIILVKAFSKIYK